MVLGISFLSQLELSNDHYYLVSIVSVTIRLKFMLSFNEFTIIVSVFRLSHFSLTKILN